MQALKAVVIGLGLLILIGFAVIVTELVRRAGGGGESGPFAAPALALPAGMRVVETTAGGERIVLRLEGAGGAGRLLVLDADSGRLLGSIDLTPAP